jgi:hypothetical protein
VSNGLQSGTITGVISAQKSLRGNIEACGTLSGALALPIIVDNSGGAVYEGEYTITPETSAQTLPTAHKRMQDDLTVLAIPYYETTNETGGNTVYIGMEVEING